MTEHRMELWSDDILSEFAIKFNSTVVVKTSNNPDVLTKMIDVLIKSVMKSIGIIPCPNGSFTTWRINMLFYLT